MDGLTSLGVVKAVRACLPAPASPRLSALRRRYGGWAVVTGGSSGIGLGFAETLAMVGFDLVLVARGEARLRAEAERMARQHRVRVEAVVADLARADGPARVIEASRGKDVGVLVSSAGSGWIGRFDIQPIERHRDQLQLHCTSAVELTAHFIGTMKARGRGAVVLISSAGGYVPLPYYSVYSGTKAFVATWGEALRPELEGTGVDLVVSAPGDTKTDFQRVSGERSTRWLPVEAVVDATLAGLGRRAVVVPGWEDRVGLLAARLLPRSLVLRLLTDRQRAQTPEDRR